MILELSAADCETFSVDRTGVVEEFDGPQGFYIWLRGLKIKFHDETDAVRIAQAVLDRMGYVSEKRRRKPTGGEA